eukprot:5271441-Pyramimonas_sp.AAC.1
MKPRSKSSFLLRLSPRFDRRTGNDKGPSCWRVEERDDGGLTSSVERTSWGGSGEASGPEPRSSRPPG